jgi:serine/threonine protein kinase
MPESSGTSHETLLGKYIVLERIGTGGMAEVYRGRHDKLGRDVAIKVMHTTLASDPQFIARFEREARLAASLRHRGIVQVFDFDKQGDRLFLVMEYVNGGTLRQRLLAVKSAGQYMPLAEVSHLLKQIAEALDYAHSQGMLHRDLKPANILLDESGDSYITDFGIARLLESEEITRTGSLLGTPDYMSPEQCEGTSLSFTSDIYSLGVILFDMLTGQSPFEADSPLATLQRQIHEPVPALAKFRKDLPSEMDAVLKKALAKDPAARYQKAVDLAADFARLVSMPVTPAAPTMRASKPAPVKKAGKSSYIWILAAVVVLAILAAAGLWYWKLRQTSLPNIARCTSVETCERNARLLTDAGRPLLAMEAYQKAVSLVPAGEQTAHAKLACDLGDAYVLLAKKPEARNAFKECINWTHNDASLESLRQYAQKRIKELK